MNKIMKKRIKKSWGKDLGRERADKDRKRKSETE
jgi:hypothetical protein